MPRVLLDFVAPGGPRGPEPPLRAALDEAVETVRAATAAEVHPALERVRQATRDGLTAAGFLAYEAAPAFEPRMRVRPGGRMPLLWFALFDGDAAAEDPRAAGGTAAGPPPDLAWRLDTPPDAHAAAVRAVRGHIADGRTYQVNLSARLRVPWQGDPLALWDGMRRAQGPGFHAYIDTGDFVIASASPELFFATRGREILTRPMKGTRPRGRWAAEDEELRSALAASAKDRAENLMIVDLLRNDLGRIARTGSVRVPRLLGVERYRTVWQMTSTITATLRDHATLADILAALFPCGSVTGAPKISTMEIIAGLEQSPREVYCGAIGIIRPGGDATFSVPIRTAWIDRERGQAEYGTGGGVVWDSTAAGEYDELLAKTLIVRAPWPPFSLVETLRLEEGVPVRLDRHLQRLRGSAEHFGFPFPEAAIRATMEGIRRAHPTGVHRVRVELDEHGRIAIQAGPLDPMPPGTTLPVALAAAPVDARDPFLFHKTTRRERYQHARAAAPPGAWDVLLLNDRGELTEFTRGTLVLELDGEHVTPPLDAGLLPGCLRGELLETGQIRERTLRAADLERADGVWFVNSLRGWVPVAIMQAAGTGPVR